MSGLNNHRFDEQPYWSDADGRVDFLGDDGERQALTAIGLEAFGCVPPHRDWIEDGRWDVEHRLLRCFYQCAGRGGCTWRIREERRRNDDGTAYVYRFQLSAAKHDKSLHRENNPGPPGMPLCTADRPAAKNQRNGLAQEAKAESVNGSESKTRQERRPSKPSDPELAAGSNTADPQQSPPPVPSAAPPVGEEQEQPIADATQQAKKTQRAKKTNTTQIRVEKPKPSFFYEVPTNIVDPCSEYLGLGGRYADRPVPGGYRAYWKSYPGGIGKAVGGQHYPYLRVIRAVTDIIVVEKLHITLADGTSITPANAARIRNELEALDEERKNDNGPDKDDFWAFYGRYAEEQKPGSVKKRRPPPPSSPPPSHVHAGRKRNRVNYNVDEMIKKQEQRGEEMQQQMIATKDAQSKKKKKKKQGTTFDDQSKLKKRQRPSAKTTPEKPLTKTKEAAESATKTKPKNQQHPSVKATSGEAKVFRPSFVYKNWNYPNDIVQACMEFLGLGEEFADQPVPGGYLPYYASIPGGSGKAISGTQYKQYRSVRDLSMIVLEYLKITEDDGTGERIAPADEVRIREHLENIDEERKKEQNYSFTPGDEQDPEKFWAFYGAYTEQRMSSTKKKKKKRPASASGPSSGRVAKKLRREEDGPKYPLEKDPNVHYIDEVAFLFHDPPDPSDPSAYKNSHEEAVPKESLPKLPPPPPPPDCPACDQTDATWSWDESTRVMLANFTKVDSVSEQDKCHLLRLMEVRNKGFCIDLFQLYTCKNMLSIMVSGTSPFGLIPFISIPPSPAHSPINFIFQRDDITLIMEGLLQFHRPHIWSFESIEREFKGHPWHKFRRFQRVVGAGDGALTYYKELKGFATMRVSEFLEYKKLREAAMQAGPHDPNVVRPFKYKDEKGTEHITDDVSDLVLYMIDVETTTNLPELDHEYKSGFKVPEILPAGKSCLTRTVRSICTQLHVCYSSFVGRMTELLFTI